MNANNMYKLKMAAARIVSVIDIPFLILAYPHILCTRRVRALTKDAMRLEFARNGMCGGSVADGAATAEPAQGEFDDMPLRG